MNVLGGVLGNDRHSVTGDERQTVRFDDDASIAPMLGENSNGD
jgi:hypothetical protein